MTKTKAVQPFKNFILDLLVQGHHDEEDFGAGPWLVTHVVN